MIFGYVLLTDWSARDGHPLTAESALKATATTLSPWIVMTAALDPFRTLTREVPTLAYLQSPAPMLYDIALELTLQPEGTAEAVISRTTTTEAAWSAAQMLAQQTCGGCAMTSGDLLGSGTLSGAKKSSLASLIELSWNGAAPFAVPGGTRSFAEDNDTLTLRGAAQGDGFTIGFGACSTKVLPALADPYAR